MNECWLGGLYNFLQNWVVVVYDHFTENSQLFEGFNISPRVSHIPFKFLSFLFEVPIMSPFLLIFLFPVVKRSCQLLFATVLVCFEQSPDITLTDLMRSCILYIIYNFTWQLTSIALVLFFHRTSLVRKALMTWHRNIGEGTNF